MDGLKRNRRLQKKRTALLHIDQSSFERELTVDFTFRTEGEGENLKN